MNKTNSIIEILKKIPLFSSLSADEAESLIKSAKISEIPSGETVTPPHDTVTVVLKGSIAVMKNELLMRMLSLGSVSGVASLYGSEQEPISCLKANKASSLAFLPGNAIRDIIRSNPDFSESYIRFLTSRIRFLNTRIRAYTSGSAEAKLAFHILYSDENGSGEIDLGISMSALADMLDIGRASLYRALDALSGCGAIERCATRIKITDRDRLSTFLKKK